MTVRVITPETAVEVLEPQVRFMLRIIDEDFAFQGNESRFSAVAQTILRSTEYRILDLDYDERIEYDGALGRLASMEWDLLEGSQAHATNSDLEGDLQALQSLIINYLTPPSGSYFIPAGLLTELQDIFPDE